MSEVGFVKKPGFDKSFKKHMKRDPRLTKAFKTFVTHKQERPPKPLPPGFRDHKLSGILSKFSEAHLGRDILIVYQDLGNVINLIKIATHAELEGPRQKSFK